MERSGNTSSDEFPTLWGARTGNTFRAAIALFEAEIPFSLRALDLRNGEHLSPQFLAVNPFGKTPVLTGITIHGTRLTLTQSNAIMFYADQIKPGHLIPSGGLPRVRTLERFFYFLTDVLGPSSSAFALRRARQLEPAKVLHDISLEAMALAEGFLSEGPFLAGCTFSIADIVAYTMIKDGMGQLPLDQLPAVRAWIVRVGERYSVKRGLSIFDLDPALITPGTTFPK